VCLRALIVDDLPAVQRWRSDLEVTRYWITRQVPDLADLKAWLEENRRTGSWTWLIQDEHGNPIGYCDVFGISEEHRHAEFALMIGERSKWGRGYAREALHVLLRYLLSDKAESGAGLHKVSLAVFADNRAARKVYQSCGFREDGVLREDMFYDGRWHDQILMSLLAREYHPRTGGATSEN
jgi:RimJ/RimL family protein N-acetyltransferase